VAGAGTVFLSLKIQQNKINTEQLIKNEIKVLYYFKEIRKLNYGIHHKNYKPSSIHCQMNSLQMKCNMNLELSNDAKLRCCIQIWMYL